MQLTRAQMGDKLLQAYSGYYDVEKPEEALCNGRQFAAAEFHSTLSRYVLSKDAKLWEAENNEFVYLFSLPELRTEDLWELRDYTLSEGLPRVRPHNEHMYTYLTALILADHVAPAVQKEIKRLHFLRNYKFSLHGFSTLRVAAWEEASGRCFTNAHGREVGDFIESLQIEKKNKAGLFKHKS